ncbi:MAG: hypothetical protein AAGH40_01225 [Verrucomicrobiota bacterium]
MKNYFLLILSFVLLAKSGFTEEKWRSGSLALLKANGQFEIATTGKFMTVNEEKTLPAYEIGILKIDSEEWCSVYAVGSNNLSLQFTGPGFFAVERFEQNTLPLEQDPEAKSRVIVNLRKGRLVFDDRSPKIQSSLILETPLGRINSSGAYWSMRIDYDENSRLYNFQMECADGLLRFTDLNGEVYMLRSRQRLSGAGSSSSPSIEAAEFTNDEEELFESYQRVVDSAAEIEISAVEMQKYMRIFQRETKVASPAASSPSSSAKVTRPLIIEFEPAPKPVTPFRGELRPPTDRETDIF